MRAITYPRPKWSPPPSSRAKAERCPRCLTLLHQYTNLRKHKRGLTCKRRFEYLSMEEKGLAWVNWKYCNLNAYKATIVSSITHGKFGDYIPYTLLMYAEFVYSNPSRVQMFAAFAASSIEEQQAHLAGLQFAYEAWRESVGEEWWNLIDDTPF